MRFLRAVAKYSKLPDKNRNKDTREGLQMTARLPIQVIKT
jgi:hypothetical protein